VALWFSVPGRGQMKGKTPAVTMPQMRAIFTGLLRKPPPEGDGNRRGGEQCLAA
jgi:hypothetical protein